MEKIWDYIWDRKISKEHEDNQKADDDLIWDD